MNCGSRSECDISAVLMPVVWMTLTDRFYVSLEAYSQTRKRFMFPLFRAGAFESVNNPPC